MGLSEIKETVENLEDPSAKLVVTEVIDYIEGNVGNLSYEGLAESITNGSWEAVKYTIDHSEWYMKLGGLLKDEGAFKESMLSLIHI